MPQDDTTINTPSPIVKRKRAQLDHALIDVDFLDKPKMVALKSRFGHEGVTFVFQFILQCSRATEAVIDWYTIKGFSERLGITDWETLLQYCIKQGMITLNSEDYSNPRVIEDQEKLARRRDEDRNRKRKERDKYRDIRVTGDRTPDTATVTDTVSDLDPNNEAPPLTIHTVNFGHPPILTFDQLDWADLVVNHFHGFDSQARTMCIDAADYLAAHGKPQPKNCLAYMRSWIRRSKEFKRGLTHEAKRGMTTEELNPELFEEIFK